MSARAAQRSGGSAPTPVKVHVAALKRGDDGAAADLAARLDLPVVDLSEVSAGDYVLTITPDGLELREGADPCTRGVRVDFRAIDVRRGSGNLSKKQPLARAIGRESRRVLDATAGLGHDAFLLAAMGYEVTAVERSPVVAALLLDGVQRALDEPQLREAIGDRLCVVNADANALMCNLRNPPDTIYLDPMFPPRRKASALARKSIRFIRAVVGEDSDAEELLQNALASGVRRVVLKRPADAPAGPVTASLIIRARLVRYEVFFPLSGAEGASSPVG